MSLVHSVDHAPQPVRAAFELRQFGREFGPGSMIIRLSRESQIFVLQYSLASDELFQLMNQEAFQGTAGGEIGSLH